MKKKRLTFFFILKGNILMTHTIKGGGASVGAVCIFSPGHWEINWHLKGKASA